MCHYGYCYSYIADVVWLKASLRQRYAILFGCRQRLRRDIADAAENARLYCQQQMKNMRMDNTGVPTSVRIIVRSTTYHFMLATACRGHVISRMGYRMSTNMSRHRHQRSFVSHRNIGPPRHAGRRGHYRQADSQLVYHAFSVNARSARPSTSPPSVV